MLFDDDLSRVTFAEVVDSKLELIQAMAQHASSMLLDPVFSIGQAIATGDLPGHVGLISGLEELSYQPESSPVGFDTTLRLKPGWSPAKLALLGCDAAKLVVFHRSDAPEELADTVHQTVSAVAGECAAHQLPLIVEPLWYPRPGESLGDPQVARGRTSSIIDTARSFSNAGADIMKLEFPTLIDTQPGRATADDACERLGEAVNTPWVLLSAGVTFAAFSEQLQIAARHGCSGFMAGRAIWGDGVGRLAPADRAASVARACQRLDQLAEIIAATGSPAWSPVPRAASPRVVPADWYAGFAESGPR